LTSLENFVRIALPLLAKDGVLISLKGRVAEDEVESLRRRVLEMPGTAETGEEKISVDMKSYSLPYLGAERSIVIVKRVCSDDL